MKKHKLGIVFYTLGNIRPEDHYFAIAATVPVIEQHGLDKILEPFIRDLNILATIGLDVTISGTSRNFQGAIKAFLADNLASKVFKISFHCCRTCLVTRESLSNGYFSSDFDMRTKIEHMKHVESLDGPTANH